MTTKMSKKRTRDAEQYVARLLRDNGWTVEQEMSGRDQAGSFVVRNSPETYIVEVKAMAESRADRVLPLLSQAILQAQAYAKDFPGFKPLAVVYGERGSSSLEKNVREFAEKYVPPHVAIGVVTGDGLVYFRGEGLQGLRSAPASGPASRFGTPTAIQSVNLFSDLNQWMLKVLLALELPGELLCAPRGPYSTFSQLAAAADVSLMSAHRFVQQLSKEGYLDTSKGYLTLVRRQTLFFQWRAAVMQRPPELPVRLLLRASAEAQLLNLLELHADQACLGLFAAADALRLGHVTGVPPHVYVPRLPGHDMRAMGWQMLTYAKDGPPDLILRKAPFPKSTFRGAVRPGGVMCTDVIQTWLDVANNPARGQEQADIIYERVIRPLINREA